MHRRELVHFSENIRCPWPLVRVFPSLTRNSRCKAGIRCLVLALTVCFASVAATDEPTSPGSADTGSADIDAMLDAAMDRKPNSRLSCQVELSDDLDGIIVEVADNGG